MSLQFGTLESYRNFGHCVTLSNGIIEAYVTVDRGPRIIHFARCGGPNLFWTDDDRQAVSRSPALHEAFGLGETYEFLGGHRLWASPEHPIDTYCPDSAPVETLQTEFGWIITAPPQPRLNLQFRIELRMSETEPSMSVRHRIENVGLEGEDALLAPWAITQLAPGGLLVFPQSKRETGLLADRFFAVWPYTNMGDPRLTWQDDYIALHQTSDQRPIKIGTHNLCGWALYHNQGFIFKKDWTPLPGGAYPDGNCSFEAYTNHNFLEMETLGVLETLPAGRCAMHEELWTCHAEPSTLTPEQLIAQYGSV